jgi:hypothetical protein
LTMLLWEKFSDRQAVGLREWSRMQPGLPARLRIRLACHACAPEQPAMFMGTYLGRER